MAHAKDMIFSFVVGKKQLRSKRSISTRPEGSLVMNPSFESRSSPPHHASRMSAAGDATRWTPYYNGGYEIFCKIFKFDSGLFLSPRSGRCHMAMGQLPTYVLFSARREMFFGAHQSVEIPQSCAHAPLLLGLWYSQGSATFRNDSETSGLFVTVSLVLSDDSIVEADLQRLDVKNNTETNTYRYFCLRLDHVALGIKVVHIYLHMNQPEAGVSFFDDIDLRVIPHLADTSACYHARILPREKDPADPPPPTVLRARNRPRQTDLTLAVPLTADLLPRLGLLSRTYDGPIVANVLVHSRDEVRVRTRSNSSFLTFRTRRLMSLWTFLSPLY